MLFKNIFQKAADATFELKPCKTNPTRRQKKHKPQKKWFDKDCSTMKALTNKMANRKHRNPGNVSIQQQHKEIMKEFKILCRRKRAKFWSEEYDKLDLLEYDSDFWEKWKNFGEDNSSHKPQSLDGKKCEEHFKSLFEKINANIDLVLEKIDRPISDILNKDFTLEELLKVVKNLAYNKAVGSDCIANEFIKAAPEKLLVLNGVLV